MKKSLSKKVPLLIVEASAPTPPPPAVKKVLLKKLPSRIDLRNLVNRNNGEPKTVLGGKDRIISGLMALITYTQDQIKASSGDDRKKHTFRIAQFKKAVASLKSHPTDIRSGKEAREIKGIGKGIGDRIDEILAQGSLHEINNAICISPETQVIRELTHITGIGDAHAKQFFDLGITSIEDLAAKSSRNEIKLTHHMQIGLKYLSDFRKKIPFDDIVTINKQLISLKHLLPDLFLEVCGSHRRQQPFSGDIDVLCCHPSIKDEMDLIMSPVHYLKTIVHSLKSIGLIIDDLTTHGDTKYMGVCLGPSGVHHRIDIRFVSYDSFYPALLYFTGSMITNKLMRTIALEKHMTLNEYGLFHFSKGVKGAKILVNSEQEIFDTLGIVYLTPEERELGKD